MRVTILRVGIILAIILLIALPRPAHADGITIDSCTESQFDAAIIKLKEGDRISFNCSGIIRITHLKLITGNVWIEAQNQHVTLTGNNANQIFMVNPKGYLFLADLTLTGAQSNGLGGAIYNRGIVAVLRTTFRGNKHGIVNFGELGVTDSTFADNLGDGIYNSGILTVDSSLFARNKHGIDNASGEVKIVNSTFVANVALPGQIGGAIANAGVLTVIGSTFADNGATGGGGAIANRLHSKASVQNTIIFTSNKDPNCFGTTFDEGHNMQYPGRTCGPTIPVVDPKLLPLADNGGPTQTVGLQADSPAIGAGDATLCQSEQQNWDQRGWLRIVGDDKTCDVGAFEFNAIETLATETPGFVPQALPQK